jgi:DNA-binding phage protein
MKTIGTYGSYSFIDKDPIIDKLRTLVKDVNLSYGKIHEESGVSVSTMYNWFHGDTKRPQFATCMAVVRACGYDLEIVRRREGKSAEIIHLPTRVRQRKRA